MMRVRGRRPASKGPPEPDLRRSRRQEVLASHDEVDALAHVVDDHAEPVGPVAVPVAHRQIAIRGDIGFVPTHDAIRPGLASVVKGDAEDGSGDATLTATARAPAT